MPGRILKYKTERIASWQLSLVAIFLIMMGFGYFSNISLGIGFTLLGGAIISATQGFQFNPTEKKYRQYLSVLFIPFGQWKTYDAIEKIFINPVAVSQKMYSRSNRPATFSHTEFQGFLKFSNGEKIVLWSEKGKSELLPYLEKMATDLNVNLEDNTTN